jgi:chromosome transmission fidelity protein 1
MQLLGFSEAARKKLMKGKENSATPQTYVVHHESPLRNIQEFLNALSNPDKDGRILVSTSQSGSNTSSKSIQYILLNPSDVFEPIVSKARAVILAGGTMKPISDFTEQLLPFMDPSSIELFSCGHVIPKNQLLPVCISAGPSGTALRLSFENRNNPLLVSQLIRSMKSGRVSMIWHALSPAE